MRRKDTEAFIASRAGGLVPGVNTALLSRNYTHPSTTLTELKHFRLLYESPETVSGLVTMYRVKIFEAHRDYEWVTIEIVKKMN